MRLRFPLALSVVGMLAGLVHTSSALACSLPPDGFGFRLVGGVKEGGLLVVEELCYTSCDGGPPASVTVRGSDGAVVPGAVVETLAKGETSAFVVWKPTAPFTAGATYTIDPVEAATSWSEVSFTAEEVKAASSLAEPEAELSGLVEGVGDAHCCGLPLYLGSCGPQSSCFFETEKEFPMVTLRWSMPANQDEGQFFARVVWSANGADVFETEFAPLRELSHAFAEEESEYCYRVEIRDVVHDANFDFEKRCVASGDQVFFEERPTAAADREATLSLCIEPPTGYEEEFCAVQETPDCAASCAETRACLHGEDTSGTGGGTGSEDPSEERPVSCAASPLAARSVGGGFGIVLGLLGLVTLRRRAFWVS